MRINSNKKKEELIQKIDYLYKKSEETSSPRYEDFLDDNVGEIESYFVFIEPGLAGSAVAIVKNGCIRDLKKFYKYSLKNQFIVEKSEIIDLCEKIKDKTAKELTLKKLDAMEALIDALFEFAEYQKNDPDMLS
jgi:hypothetical protein